MKKDGAEFYAQPECIVVQDAEGNYTLIRAAVSNINERKRAEGLLRESMHNLSERIKELNCLYDISKLIEKPGISLQEILQGTVNLIPPAWEYPEITCTRIILEEKEFRTENFIETTWKQTSSIRAYGENIGTLAGGIAHNFNNLLMGIQGNASLMLLETDPTHPNYERLKTIERSVQSGSKLTKQLLGYAREGRYEIRPISLNQLAEETSNTFGTTKKEIRVHQELDKDLSGIKAGQS